MRCHPICNLVEQLGKLASQHVERFKYLMVIALHYYTPTLKGRAAWILPYTT